MTDTPCTKTCLVFVDQLRDLQDLVVEEPERMRMPPGATRNHTRRRDYERRLEQVRLPWSQQFTNRRQTLMQEGVSAAWSFVLQRAQQEAAAHGIAHAILFPSLTQPAVLIIVWHIACLLSCPGS